MRGPRPNGAVQPRKIILKRRKEGSKDKGSNMRRPSLIRQVNQVVVTMQTPNF